MGQQLRHSTVRHLHSWHLNKLHARTTTRFNLQVFHQIDHGPAPHPAFHLDK
jgi:hypothetical protein